MKQYFSSCDRIKWFYRIHRMGFHHGKGWLVMSRVRLVLRGSKPWTLTVVMELLMATAVNNFCLLSTLHALARRNCPKNILTYFSNIGVSWIHGSLLRAYISLLSHLTARCGHLPRVWPKGYEQKHPIFFSLPPLTWNTDLASHMITYMRTRTRYDIESRMKIPRTLTQLKCYTPFRPAPQNGYRWENKTSLKMMQWVCWGLL